jgi:hypothetical protein
LNHQLLREHLLSLEESLLKPEVRINTKKLENLLSKDFFEFGSSGRAWYREDCLKDGGLSIRELHLYDFEIQPLSEDVVLATYQLKDHDRNQVTLRSSIWKLIEGRWQMYFHQGTVI